MIGAIPVTLDERGFGVTKSQRPIEFEPWGCGAKPCGNLKTWLGMPCRLTTSRDSFPTGPRALAKAVKGRTLFGKLSGKLRVPKAPWFAWGSPVWQLHSVPSHIGMSAGEFRFSQGGGGVAAALSEPAKGRRVAQPVQLAPQPARRLTHLIIRLATSIRYDFFLTDFPSFPATHPPGCWCWCC